MAITVDAIVSKVFTVVQSGGYDNDEVEAFLDEIIEEMENREAQAEQLKAQIASLTRELAAAREQAAKTPAPVVGDAHTSESFELVLTKAKSAYEEIVAAADVRAKEITTKAEADAAAMRQKAELEMTDLSQKLNAVKAQTAQYYATMKTAIDSQSAALEQMKNLL